MCKQLLRLLWSNAVVADWPIRDWQVLNHKSGRAFIYVLVGDAANATEETTVFVPLPDVDVPDLNPIDSRDTHGRYRGVLHGAALGAGAHTIMLRLRFPAPSIGFSSQVPQWLLAIGADGGGGGERWLWHGGERFEIGSAALHFGNVSDLACTTQVCDLRTVVSTWDGSRYRLFVDGKLMVKPRRASCIAPVACLVLLGSTFSSDCIAP